MTEPDKELQDAGAVIDPRNSMDEEDIQRAADSAQN